jgi:MoaA/NifB/PqqE/SkfB family radical SAM enzyme
MYKYEDIRKVHLEITSHCNASCPQCSRNFFGRPLEDLPLAELTLDDVRTIFPPPFIARLKVMFMSGTYGDAMVARDTLEVFEYFRACNPSMRLGMHTNGSGRKPDWWKRLAGVVDYCAFGIDGLSDTNQLYRRGTRWQKVMESAEAFIAGGGHAEWHFIVFRHNEHQVEEARELARRLGFKEFSVKRTGRFLKHWRSVPSSPVLDREGRFEYFLEMPEDPRYHNKPFLQLYGDRQSAERHLAETPIDCKAAGSRSIYVSAEGLVFPCCFTATIYPMRSPTESEEVQRIIAQLPGGADNARRVRGMRTKGLEEVKRLIDQLPGGKDAINAKKVPMKEIVEGRFFQELIPKGWEAKSFDEGRLRICSKTCGVFKLRGSRNLDREALAARVPEEPGSSVRVRVRP